MALLDTIPGVEDFIRDRVEQGATHKVLSDELKASYPLISRGLSSRSVRRFCEARDIHSSSRLSDVQLDTVVKTSIHKVSYMLQICIILLHVHVHVRTSASEL